MKVRPLFEFLFWYINPCCSIWCLSRFG